MGFLNNLFQSEPSKQIKPSNLVEIDKDELAWLKKQAKENPSRGQIVTGFQLSDYLGDESKLDPEYSEFQKLLTGEKWFDENIGKQTFNTWIKLRQLVEQIAEAYHTAFIEELDRGYGYSYKYTIDIDDPSIKVQWIETYSDQFEQETGRGEFHFPAELLWSNWKKICDDELARRKKIVKDQQKDWQAKQDQYYEDRRKERYEEAKKIISEFENKQQKEI